MFRPLRFNKLLKAVPGLAHLQLTPQAATHSSSKAYVHVKEKIEVDKKHGHESGEKVSHVHEHITKDVTIANPRTSKTVSVHEHVVEDVEVKEHKNRQGETTETISRVHATIVDVAEIEMTPPHLPREETPTYQHTHHHLVYTLDTPCAICGVRNSTLKDPRENPFKATAIETHHYPIERSLLNACDPKKVHVIFGEVKDYAALEAFIDSEENMMVLCDIHHRHPHYGIHHLLAQDFFIQPFLYGGYQIIADENEAKQVMAQNERVIARHSQQQEQKPHSQQKPHPHQQEQKPHHH